MFVTICSLPIWGFHLIVAIFSLLFSLFLDLLFFFFKEQVQKKKGFTDEELHGKYWLYAE